MGLPTPRPVAHRRRVEAGGLPAHPGSSGVPCIHGNRPAGIAEGVSECVEVVTGRTALGRATTVGPSCGKGVGRLLMDARTTGMGRDSWRAPRLRSVLVPQGLGRASERVKRLGRQRTSSVGGRYVYRGKGLPGRDPPRAADPGVVLVRMEDASRVQQHLKAYDAEIYARRVELTVDDMESFDPGPARPGIPERPRAGTTRENR